MRFGDRRWVILNPETPVRQYNPNPVLTTLEESDPNKEPADPNSEPPVQEFNPNSEHVDESEPEQPVDDPNPNQEDAKKEVNSKSSSEESNLKYRNMLLLMNKIRRNRPNSKSSSKDPKDLKFNVKSNLKDVVADEQDTIKIKEYSEADLKAITMWKLRVELLVQILTAVKIIVELSGAPNATFIIAKIIEMMKSTFAKL